MKRRAFSLVSAASAILAGCTFAFWLATFLVTPWHQKLSFSRSFHVALWRGPSGDTLGRLVFFNNAQYGPYTGSTIQIMDNKGNAYPRLEREMGWGDTLGVYYRYFRWPGGGTLWTLAVSLWYPLLVFCILPAAWFYHKKSCNLSVEMPQEQV